MKMKIKTKSSKISSRWFVSQSYTFKFMYIRYFQLTYAVQQGNYALNVGISQSVHYTTLHMRSLEHLACRKNEDLLNQTYHFIVYYLFIHLLLLRMWILIQHMYVHIFKWDCVGMIANRKKIYRKITILYHITLHYIVFYSIRFDSHIVKVQTRRYHNITLPQTHLLFVTYAPLFPSCIVRHFTNDQITTSIINIVSFTSSHSEFKFTVNYRFFVYHHGRCQSA